MRLIPILLALLLGLPALVPPAASSHALGLIDPASPGPASSHLDWTGTIQGKAFMATCSGPCTVFPPPEADCSGTDCDAYPVEVHVPAGHWSTHRGGLRAVVWVGNDLDHMAIARIRDATGTVVAQGSSGAASVAFLPHVADGDYTIEVQGSFGTGSYDLDLYLESEAAADGDLLPDLVTLTPDELHVGACQTEEQIEEGAARCLRFGNRIANLGEGPLEVRIGPVDAGLGLAGMGQWAQRIQNKNGTVRDEDVGSAVFHPIHGHYHYADVARYAIYSYDLATDTRGALVNDGRKAGFCLLDSGVADPDHDGLGDATYRLEDCLLPLETGNTRMGVSVGWFDHYGPEISEQYVEITGVPDGTYELVSISDPDNTLLETDDSNNEASVLFQLAGSAVTVLGPP